MANKTSQEGHTNSAEGGSAVDKIKKEMGPTGFVGSIVGLVVIVIASVIYFINYNKNQKNEEGLNDMFQAQYYFEQDSLDLALNGDGRNLGFLSIMDIYSGTEAAELSSFYTGSIYMKLQQFDDALGYLKTFTNGDILVQARGYALTGDAYMELGNFSDAAEEYTKAASTVDDKFFAPGYLMKASLAHEKLGDFTGAIVPLEKIINKYFGSAEVAKARKHRARLEGLAGK
ncbi:MAG: tetratricopeptide (TPR) repeat protein [Roseivirga sp.]|jgi:tetratricopeptide (TPR) repeat protein